MIELEGDSHTFLHDVNLELLFHAGTISEKALNVIRKIRLNMEVIDRDKWKAELFLFDKSWCEIRDLVIGLYLEGLK